ncbi:hypothetical protein BT69DRAFT_1322090 [Atractiella rhizophila]|nr:hypothetical protein BT69DRAFT_1322090 [Atractiella rhizophila]
MATNGTSGVIYVFARHDFEAENPDELSFKAGERIRVIEKDEVYQDGWWQGENALGAFGIFPGSYTSEEPPEGYVPPSEPLRSTSSNGVMSSTLNEIDNHLSTLDSSSLSTSSSMQHRTSGGGTTLHTIAEGPDDDTSSFRPDDEDADTESQAGSADEDETFDPHKARELLAEKAKLNLSKQLEAERKKRERQRTEEEAMWARLNAGGVDGLEISDESEEEEGEGPLSKKMAEEEEEERTREFDARMKGMGLDISPEERREQLEKAKDTALPPSPALVTSFEDVKGVPLNDGGSKLKDYLLPTPNSEEVEELAIPTSDSQPQPSVAVEPQSQPQPETSPVPQAYALSPIDPTAPVFPLSASPEPRSALVPSPSPEPFAQAGQASPSPAPSPVANPALLASTTTATTATTTEENASNAVSTSAYTNGAPAGVTTANTSARSSVQEPTSVAEKKHPPALEKKKSPLEWTVDEVVEWGKERGFDQVTLSKLAEHEISGDVLLEMDVTTLKEIDLPQFGRRVHIYNGIKELKASLLPPPPAPASSPPPTTPLTPGLGSPFIGSPAPSYQDSQKSPRPKTASSLAQSGAGYEDYEERSRRVSQRTTSSAGGGYESDAPVGFVGAGRARGTNGKYPGHVRSATTGTNESFNTASERGYGGREGMEEIRDVEEEEEERGVLTDSEVVAPTKRFMTRLKAHGSTPGDETDNFKLKEKGTPTTASFEEKEGVSTRPLSTASTPSSPSVKDKEKEKKEKKEKEKKGFLGGTLRAKGRKPAPKYSLTEKEAEELGKLTEKDKEMKRLMSVATPAGTARMNSTSGKRSTRLFHFGSSSHEKDVSATPMSVSPTQASNNSAVTKNVISPPLEAGSKNIVRSVSQANPTRPVPGGSGAMSATPSAPAKVGGAAIPVQRNQVKQGPLAQIGEPDFSGWMQKKGEKYNTWKTRFMLLKGVYLYYMKSPNEAKIKGYVNLTGYKIIPDAEINPGKFGFKAIHDEGPPHFFSHNESDVIRAWMKAMMKATIGRDYSAPVVSSCNIDTIPLSVAQSMYPPPRPPSPTSRGRIQRARYQDPTQLSAKDAAVLMGFQNSSDTLGTRSSMLAGALAARSASPSRTPKSSPGSNSKVTKPNRSVKRKALTKAEKSDKTEKADRHSSLSMRKQGSQEPVSTETTPVAPTPTPAEDDPLLVWVNSHLPDSCEAATDFSSSLQSGKVITRLLERLSGQFSDISDAEFATFKGTKEVDMDHLGASFPPALNQFNEDNANADTLFKVFDFIIKCNVGTEDVSINDMVQGRQMQLTKLLTLIRDHYSTSA